MLKADWEKVALISRSLFAIAVLLVGMWMTNGLVDAQGLVEEEVSGNSHYTLLLIPDASHDVYAVADGQAAVGVFAPDYTQTMIAWVQAVIHGEHTGTRADALPSNELPTRPAVTDLSGLARWDIQLAYFMVFQLAFGGYFAVAGIRRLRGMTTENLSGHWLARTLAGLGLVTSWGLYFYVSYITITAGEQITAVVAGRPAGWFVLQVLAVALLIAAIFLGVSWYRDRSAWGREGVRMGLMLAGTLLFVPWAIWWQLFSF